MSLNCVLKGNGSGLLEPFLRPCYSKGRFLCILSRKFVAPLRAEMVGHVAERKCSVYATITLYIFFWPSLLMKNVALLNRVCPQIVSHKPA